MKELRVTKMVEQTTVTFVADDGKTFDNERDCRNYEAQKNREACISKYMDLNPIRIEEDVFEFWQCGASIHIVVANNEREVDIIRNYFNLRSTDCEIFDPESYPHKYVIQFDECGGADRDPLQVQKMIEGLKRAVRLMEQANEL